VFHSGLWSLRPGWLVNGITAKEGKVAVLFPQLPDGSVFILLGTVTKINLKSVDTMAQSLVGKNHSAITHFFHVVCPFVVAYL
jgi:hypothetical protein